MWCIFMFACSFEHGSTSQLTFIPLMEFANHCGNNDFTLIPTSSLLILMFILPCLSVVSHTEFDLSVPYQLNVVVVPVVVCQPNMLF